MKNLNLAMFFKLITIFLIIVIPFSSFFFDSKAEAIQMGLQDVGFYKNNTCEVSLMDFLTENFYTKNIVIKNDIFSTIDCFGKVNGVDIIGGDAFVYIGTNININIVLQGIIWIILISFLSKGVIKPKLLFFRPLIFSAFITFQYLTEQRFYINQSKNFNNELTADNYFLINIFLAYFIILILVDYFVIPRVNNFLNCFPYLFLIIGTFSAANMNFYLLIFSYIGFITVNKKALLNKYSLLYFLFVPFWFYNNIGEETYFDNDKLRGFVSTSNNTLSIIFWIILIYLFFVGINYLLENSIDEFQFYKLKNNFLISGATILLFGILGAQNTFINYLNYFIFGQNKIGMRTFESVAGNTWRGFSASAEAVAEFQGVAVLLTIFYIFNYKKFKLKDIFLLLVNLFGIYKANDVAVIVSLIIITFLYFVSKKGVTNLLKTKYNILFIVSLVISAGFLYTNANPGVSRDYSFLSENLLIESIKKSVYFEPVNKEVENYLYRSNFIDIKKLDSSDRKLSKSTYLLLDNYISDNNIKFLPNSTSIISITSSVINRTEKWAYFVAKYSPNIGEFFFGFGPMQFNNYYFSHETSELPGLTLPHSSLLDILIFTGLFGIFILNYFVLKNIKSFKNNFLLITIFLIINLMKSDSILYLSSCIMIVNIFFLSKRELVSIEK